MPYPSTNGTEGEGTANVFDDAVGTGVAVGDGGVSHGSLESGEVVQWWWLCVVAGVQRRRRSWIDEDLAKPLTKKRERRGEWGKIPTNHR